MSLGRCIPGLVKAGKLTKEQGAAAEELYNRRRRFHERSMGAEAADTLASTEAADALEAAAKRKWQLEALKVRAQQTMLGKIMDADGAINPKEVRNVVQRVDLRRQAIQSRAEAMSEGILADHRRTITGAMRNKAQMENIVRELFGKDTGDLSAKELADAWRKTAEMLRRRFNAAGGGIGKLEDWGLPQSHDSTKIRRAGWDEWRDFVLGTAERPGMLDRSRMIDDATGKPFDDQTLEAVLHDVYETIRTEGAADRVAGAAGKGMLANRNAEHRFLHFKDPDAWLAYQARFGKGTPFDAMMGHIRGMSRDIAAMEILGPNPDATVKWLKDSVAKDAALRTDAEGKLLNQSNVTQFATQRLWDEYSGSLRRPVDRRLAIAGGTYRSIASAAKLGSAPIAAISDMATGATTRAFNGLPVMSIVNDYLKLLNPASAADRRLAIRLGLGAQGWANIVATGNRYMLSEMGHDTSRRVSDAVMRASGLEAFTNAGKWANGLAWLGFLTEERGKTWGEMNSRVRAAMQRYDIDEAAWDKIRSAKLERDGGVDWIKPSNIEDQAVGDKLLEMIHAEGDFAVPTPDLKTRATMHSLAKPGTVMGELMMSGPLLFKSFGISVMLNHLGRMMDMPTLPGKLGYLAALSVPMTVAGILSTQLAEVDKGRDFKPYSKGLLLQGALKGGGWGLAGDLFNLMAEKRVSGLGEYLGGPLLEDTKKTGSAAIDLARPLVDDSEQARNAQARAPWKLAQVAKGNLPGQSLWYARLAFDRLVADRVQELIDPHVAESRRTAQRNAQKQGQGYYWEPGKTAPTRAPDYENALRELPQ